MNIPFTYTKKNLIFNEFHSQLPVAIKKKYGHLIYLSCRDEINRSRIYYIKINKDFKKFYVSNYVLNLGKKGEFDEDGTMTSCLIDDFFYYTGWSVSRNKPYSHSIGLAKICKNNKLKKLGPIILSQKEEHFLCSSPFVMKTDSTWKMWYISGKGCGGWTDFGPLYSIDYAESTDGVKWNNKPIFFPRKEMEIFARPYVFFEKENYFMLYTWMILSKSKNYKIGLAKSSDGIYWERLNDNFIDYSESGWDSQMTAFPYKVDNFLFYSGNNFGKGGIGYAEQNNRIV